MSDTITNILTWIGGLTIGGAAVTAIVYEAFKHLSSKWLDEKFETRLQKLRHDQEKEMARMQFEISKMFDRATKLHQAEFEVLPQMWEKLNASFWLARQAVSSLISHPQVTSLTPPQLQEFVSGLDWPQHEKNDLLRAPSDQHRGEIFFKMWQRHKLWDAEKLARESNTFAMNQGLFIEAAISEKIKVINDMIWDALVEHGVNLHPAMGHARGELLRDKINRLAQEGEDLMTDLRRAIQARVWSAPEEERRAA